MSENRYLKLAFLKNRIMYRCVYPQRWQPRQLWNMAMFQIAW